MNTTCELWWYPLALLWSQVCQLPQESCYCQKVPRDWGVQVQPLTCIVAEKFSTQILLWLFHLSLRCSAIWVVVPFKTNVRRMLLGYVKKRLLSPHTDLEGTGSGRGTSITPWEKWAPTHSPINLGCPRGTSGWVWHVSDSKRRRICDGMQRKTFLTLHKSYYEKFKEGAKDREREGSGHLGDEQAMGK